MAFIKKIIKTAITAALVLFTAVLYGEDKTEEAWFKFNGSEVTIKSSQSALKQGDVIGMEIYRAKEAGKKYTDGPQARRLARILAGENDTFDCVLITEKEGSMRLVTALEKNGATTVSEMALPAGKPDKKWREDPLGKFPGSVWEACLETGYVNKSSNYCNIYRTKKTQLSSIKAFYKMLLERKVWQVTAEWEDAGSYFFMALKDQESLLVSVTVNDDGSFYINIAG